MTTPPLSPEAERVLNALKRDWFDTLWCQKDDFSKFDESEVREVVSFLFEDLAELGLMIVDRKQVESMALPAACPHAYVQRVSWCCERCGEAMGSDAP